MKTAMDVERPQMKTAVGVVDAYDAAADAKNRVSLRGATAKYFHVQVLANGGYLLAPRVLVPPECCVSERTLHMIGQAAGNLKKGRASAPVDLAAHF